MESRLQSRSELALLLGFFLSLSVLPHPTHDGFKHLGQDNVIKGPEKSPAQVEGPQALQ